jgi:hypothetical protein
VLEEILNCVIEQVFPLTSAMRHFVACEIRIINPFRERGEVAGRPKVLKPTNDIEIRERVVADVYLANDANPGLLQFVVQFDFRKLFGKLPKKQNLV